MSSVSRHTFSKLFQLRTGHGALGKYLRTRGINEWFQGVCLYADVKVAVSARVIGSDVRWRETNVFEISCLLCMSFCFVILYVTIWCKDNKLIFYLIYIRRHVISKGNSTTLAIMTSFRLFRHFLWILLKLSLSLPWIAKLHTSIPYSKLGSTKAIKRLFTSSQNDLNYLPWLLTYKN